MASRQTADVIEVFVASPGDVGDERTYAREFLESELPQRLAVHGRGVHFNVVCWDHPALGTPMDARLTPQEAFLKYKKAPRDCDIVIVILWSRMGTHLDLSKFPRSGGGQYASGTEWEFEDAMAAPNRPPVLVYFREDPPELNALSESFAEDDGQYQKVGAFLQRFRGPDKAWTGGLETYRGLGGFKKKLRDHVEQVALDILDTRAAPPRPVPRTTPPYTPPPFEAHPRYTPGHDFQGRVTELRALDDWARGKAPVMVVEAIGGMGKSMLTWSWVRDNATALGIPWAGRFWYSFYERGADMRDFKARALAWMTGEDHEAIRQRGETAVTEALLHNLSTRRWLLVLDGLERVLAAYHRADAAQVRDDEIDPDTGMISRQPTDCIRPMDDHLLRSLAAERPSRVLITSRLMPRALCTFAGVLPGVTHLPLHGLTPSDAAAMLVGVKGDPARRERYLERAFGGHPLLTGFVAGLIANAPWVRGMSFEQWEDDPRGGASIDLTDPDILNRHNNARNNILKLAFDALEPGKQELLARMGMLANAVGWDVLEALNPARPDPPDEVEEPTPPDQDWLQAVLSKPLSDAKKENERADLKREIAEYTPEGARAYEAARVAYEGYQAAFVAWRDSPEVAAAKRWLGDALVDLKSRGLLQHDREQGTFDLHPVVRGYAVGRMDPAARAAHGQRVADHFSGRPTLDYDRVTSASELTDRIQVVRALTLAGKLQEALDLLGTRNSGLSWTMLRLELHDLRLALVRSMFPNGFAAPPKGVGSLGSLANFTALNLAAVGRRKEAEAQIVFAIGERASVRLERDLAVRIRNHSIILDGQNRLAGRTRSLALARSVAATVGATEEAFRCNVFRIQDLVDRNDLSQARLVWQFCADQHVAERRLQAQSLLAQAQLLYREGRLGETPLREALERVRALGQRHSERSLRHLLGVWLLTARRPADALVAFDSAIIMARELGLPDPASEAERGIALHRRQRTHEAENALRAAERASEPSYSALAELCLALGHHEKARDHARHGYRWAWADGPPYYHHWDLERCRAVLRALGESEPQLPRHEPGNVLPLPYEVKIERLLAQWHKALKDLPRPP